VCVRVVGLKLVQESEIKEFVCVCVRERERVCVLKCGKKCVDGPMLVLGRKRLKINDAKNKNENGRLKMEERMQNVRERGDRDKERHRDRER